MSSLKICVLGRNHDDWEKATVEVLRLLGSPKATIKDDDGVLYGGQIEGGLCITIENGTSEMGLKAHRKMNYLRDGRGIYKWLIE